MLYLLSNPCISQTDQSPCPSPSPSLDDGVRLPVGPVDVVSEHGDGERVLQVGVVLQHDSVVGAVIPHRLYRVQSGGGGREGGGGGKWVV